jgi:hypothetical protein
MKTGNLKNMVAALALGILACGATSVPAQDSSASTATPQLAYGVPQILQLAQAKVGDDTIIAYIKNSGDGFGLTADQIIYLKQQGISDAVITTMLNQPKPGVAATTPATPAPQLAAPTAVAAPTPTPAPTVTYIQSAPPTTYYYQPYYYPAYYPVYSVFPAVSLSFGWGGYYRGGYGGWHGGGWHR